MPLKLENTVKACESQAFRKSGPLRSPYIVKAGVPSHRRLDITDWTTALADTQETEAEALRATVPITTPQHRVLDSPSAAQGLESMPSTGGQGEAGEKRKKRRRAGDGSATGCSPASLTT